MPQNEGFMVAAYVVAAVVYVVYSASLLRRALKALRSQSGGEH